jgi:hypothetical protein
MVIYLKRIIPACPDFYLINTMALFTPLQFLIHLRMLVLPDSGDGVVISDTIACLLPGPRSLPERDWRRGVAGPRPRPAPRCILLVCMRGSERAAAHCRAERAFGQRAALVLLFSAAAAHH